MFYKGHSKYSFCILYPICIGGFQSNTGHLEKLDDGGLDFGLEGAAGSAVWLGSGLQYGFVFLYFRWKS